MSRGAPSQSDTPPPHPSAAFYLPERVYGRARELSLLESVFQQSRRGRAKLLMLVGPPGIGKSALATELMATVQQAGGLLLAGRFQPSPHDRPYQALTEALRLRLRLLLSGPGQGLETWRQALAEALGTRSGLLVGLLPELRHLVPIPPQSRGVEPAQAQVRLRVAFATLIRTLCSPEQPLVLFLDDLHWADEDSLELIAFILTEPDLSGLLLMGALEAAEGASHPAAGSPLDKLFTAMETRGQLALWLELTPLSSDACAELVADACGCSSVHAGALAGILREKSGGNPFFLRTFLLRLVQDGLLWRSQEEWHWSLDRIAQESVSDNVAGLMLDTLARLPELSRYPLSMAACLGQSFELALLALAIAADGGDGRLEAVWRSLLPALSPGLLQPVASGLDELIPAAQDTEDAPREQLAPDSDLSLQVLRFAHARIQNAGVSLLSGEAVARTHLAIARALLHRQLSGRSAGGAEPSSRELLSVFKDLTASEAQCLEEETLFSLVSHLVPALPLLNDAERPAVAELAALAGAQAKGSAAFELAWTCHRLGLEALGLLPPTSSGPDETRHPERQATVAGVSPAVQAIWQAHPSLCSRLCSGGAEAAFVLGLRSEPDFLLSVVLANASDLVSALPAWSTRLQMLIADDQFAQALKVADAFFTQAGEPQLHRASWLRVLWSICWIVLVLRRHTPESLISLPIVTDPLAAGCQRIQLLLAPAHLVVEPLRHPLTILRDVRSVLLHGVSPYGAQSWTGLGLLLIGLFGKVQLANRYADLALALGERLRHERHLDQDVRPRLGFMVYALIRPWSTPVRELLPVLDRYAQEGLSTGDLNAGLSCVSHFDVYAFFAGESLERLASRMAQSQVLFARHRNVAMIRYHHPFVYLVNVLRGQEVEAAPFSAMHPAPQADSSPQEGGAAAIQNLWGDVNEALSVLLLALHLDEPMRAFERLQASPTSLKSPVQLSVKVFWWPYAAVAWWQSLALGVVTARQARPHLRKAARLLKIWCQHEPSRRYMQTWIEASRLRAQGQSSVSLVRYELAIQQALEGGYTPDAAMISRQAAELCDALGFKAQALAHRLRALEGYQTWGAIRVVQQLLSRWPELQSTQASALSEAPLAEQARAAHELLMSALQASRQVMEEAESSRLPALILQHGLTLTRASFGALVLKTTGGPQCLAVKLPMLPEAAQAVSGQVLSAQVLSAQVLSGQVLSAQVLSAQAVLEVPGTKGKSGPAEAVIVPPELPHAQQAPCSLDELMHAPLGILRYVLRTGEAVVLDNALSEGAFQREPFVLSTRTRSLLCLPLLHAGDVRGCLLLLEPSQEKLFQPLQVESVRLLAAQAVSALQNVSHAEALELEVKQRTQALEAARQKAELASTVRRDFLSHMSHELRTPLNAILGYARLLQREQTSATDVEEGLRRIEASGQHLLQLINDVLDMARLEAERLELTPGEFSLAALLQEVWGLLCASAREKGLGLEVGMAPEVPMVAWGDEGRLRQVLLNLLSNALKFTRQGGVSLWVQRVEEKSTPHEPVVRFEIADTGPGIPSERLQAIFEPFEQAGAGQERVKGTGLGLSISQKLVRLMGGELAVESVLSHGSRFHFELRLARASAPVGQTMRWGDGREGSATEASVSVEARGPLPSRPALLQLQHLARLGNLGQLTQEARALRQATPELQAFAVQLEGLAAEFEDELILTLINESLEASSQESPEIRTDVSG